MSGRPCVGHSQPVKIRPRFLFVDDDSLVLRSLRKMLRTMRPWWEITLATSPSQALEQVRGRTFHVLVADATLLAREAPGILHEAARVAPTMARVVHSVLPEIAAHAALCHEAEFLLSKALDAGEFLSTLDCAFEVSGPLDHDCSAAG
jgi:DNA-binding NtrC family response regulator